MNVACQLNGAERGRCDWRLVECMLSLSIIVAKRNQTDASRMEDALTAVITHRHGDHFLACRGWLAEAPPPVSL